MAERVDRLLRVNTLLKQEIADYFEKGLIVASGMLVSITEVKAGSDLRNATVKVSIFGGGESERVATMREIEHIRPDLQRKLARTLGFKHTPVLRFENDRRTELGDRVLELLGGAESEAKSSDE